MSKFVAESRGDSSSVNELLRVVTPLIVVEPDDREAEEMLCSAGRASYSGTNLRP